MEHVSFEDCFRMCDVLWFLGPVLMDEYVEWHKARFAINTDTL